MGRPYVQHGGGSRSLGTWTPRAGGTCQHGLTPAEQRPPTAAATRPGSWRGMDAACSAAGLGWG
jgi:hypothetical protein